VPSRTVYDTLGLEALEAASDPAAYAAIQRLARRLHEENRQVIALLPAGLEVAIPPLMVHLGQALADYSGLEVSLLDANTRHPGFSKALLQAMADDDQSSFFTLQLAQKLRLVAPRANPEVGMGLRAIAEVLSETRRDGGLVLVDLTGYAQSGEHWAGLALVDGVLTVARTGRSSEAEVQAAEASTPPGTSLGVLLLG
jgi:hypothetical protein